VAKPIQRWLHLATLVGFAISQPLYDLLGKNPTFFIARGSRPVDVVVLAVTFSLLIPLLLILIRYLIAKLSEKTARGLSSILVVILCSLFLLPIIKKVVAMPGLLLIPISLLGGLGIAQLYKRTNGAKLFLNFLTPAIIIFPTIFLFNSPVIHSPFDTRVIPAEVSKIKEGQSKNLPPIFLILFDEFPLVSLLDENYLIDRGRYPNFAELADRSHWFRNGTSVATLTHYAVPAIFTGKYPDRTKAPNFRDYPNSIFSLLRGHYKIHADETITSVCPEDLCPGNKISIKQRMRHLFTDLGIIYQHMVLPADLTGHLPTIDFKWGGFANSNSEEYQRKRNDGKYHFAHAAMRSKWRTIRQKYKQSGHGFFFQNFVDEIKVSGEKPPFYFYHSLLPHIPYKYLPSGNRYFGGDYPKKKGRVWHPEDDQKILNAWQRHLLQVGYTDSVLGYFLNKLHAEGLFDQSLIIVTSDHGVSHMPGEMRRRLSGKNTYDLASVPLFIKLPFQMKGVLSEKNVESIDILPTISELVGINIDYHIDGMPIFSSNHKEREKKTIYKGFADKNGEFQKVVFESTVKGLSDTLMKQIELFGTGTFDSIYKIGPSRHLMGSSTDSFNTEKELAGRYTIHGSDHFDNVDLNSGFLPAFVWGEITSKGQLSSNKLAIVLNGKIQATSIIQKKNNQFFALIPEGAFVNGKNSLQIYFILGEGEMLSLEHVSPKS